MMSTFFKKHSCSHSKQRMIIDNNEIHINNLTKKIKLAFNNLSSFFIYRQGYNKCCAMPKFTVNFQCTTIFLYHINTNNHPESASLFTCRSCGCMTRKKKKKFFT